MSIGKIKASILSNKLSPYIGLPFICAALILFRIGRTDTFILLKFELIAILGYFAAIHDLKTKLIPNNLVLAMLSVWVIMIIPKLFVDTDAGFSMLADSLLGFAIGGGLFMITYFVSRKGLGGGDVKFIAASGLYLGFYSTITAILYGSILAALTGLVLILFKKIRRKDSIPLAPFLYIGILIIIFLV
jgi:Flp pilus assembly protein protease CpaA